MRQNPARGFIDGYYRLVESCRNSENRVCHRTMLNVGFLDMDEVNESQLNRIQKILTLRSECSTGSLFEEKTEDPTVRHYADTLSGMIDSIRLKTSLSAGKATVVMDAGIATDANLQMFCCRGV
jgi:hypothetical protein